MSLYRLTGVRIAVLFAIMVCLGIGLAAYRHVVRSLYPIHYGAVIEASARESAVDPFLLASMIRVESGFRPDALSRKGARGLMQILPSTGRWIAETRRMVPYSDEYLYRPELNINMGAWYLSELRREFGSTLAAVAAFNAGRRNVKRWMDDGRWDGSAKGLDGLPFPETRVYVRRVMNARNWYHRVYRGHWPAE